MTYEGSATTRIKSIEVDTGFDNNAEAPFSVIVVDADRKTDSIIIATQSGAKITGKYLDENELDHFMVNASPATDGGSMTLVLHPMKGVTFSGKYNINSCRKIIFILGFERFRQFL